MKAKNSSTIVLSIDRHDQTIDVNTILYAQVTDKLCTIHLTQRAPIQVFLTLSSLLHMLPENEFLQISRSCLVSLKHIQTVNDSAVILTDGSRLPYTNKKKAAILHAFEQDLGKRAEANQTFNWGPDFTSEFRCFDRCPIPFFILEAVAESDSQTPVFVFRYANEAMATFKNTSLDRLINSHFRPNNASGEEQFIDTLINVAYKGQMKGWTETQLGIKLQIICYQPYFGFCACFIFPSLMMGQ